MSTHPFEVVSKAVLINMLNNIYIISKDELFDLFNHGTPSFETDDGEQLFSIVYTDSEWALKARAIFNKMRSRLLLSCHSMDYNTLVFEPGEIDHDLHMQFINSMSLLHRCYLTLKNTSITGVDYGI